MSLLGIDVGTSGCKAAAFSEGGSQLAFAYREYAVLNPQPDWAELDSHSVWGHVQDVIREVATATSADPVTALCVSSMGEAVTPVTAGRDILGTSILSSDPRGAEYVAELEEKIPQATFYRINPNILGSQYAMPKLLWLREHDPELYAKADRFLLWGDLVAFLLGCEATANYSLANRTLLFDIHAEDWSDELLRATGLDRAKLGRTVAGGEVIGTVSDGMAEALGLPKGVQVVAGGHDQCCNALGAGICEAGRAVCGIGTFECITPVFDHVPDAAAMLGNGLNVEHHVLPGLYVAFIYNQGGVLVKWFRNTFAAEAGGAGPGESVFDVLSREMPEDPTRLVTLPYFEMTGPPAFVGDASGVIAGLKTNTSRGEILKSIMECVTFYFVESIAALDQMGISTGEFIATGGGAQSDPWLQIKADILGVPFVRPKVTEGSLLGAAILAGAATGTFGSVAEGVGRFVVRDRVFEPDRERHAIYGERHERYRRLFPLLHDYLATL